MGSQVLTGRATRWDMDMVELRITATATLTYLHGDNLGSVSLTTNAAGQKVSEQRYKPYGEVRWSSGAGMPTDFTFTGQRAGPANYVGSLMDYVARGYSPALGRFVSADTIVPGAGNPHAFNRYMYVSGNPLGFVDPSGHMQRDDRDDGIKVTEEVMAGWFIQQIVRVGAPSGRFTLQNAPNAPQDLLRLNDAEKRNFGDHPLEYIGAAGTETEALGRAEALFPGEINRGRGDAFRHAYWNALMTVRVGPDASNRINEAHEIGGGGEPVDGMMDRHNNSVGIQIGNALVQARAVFAPEENLMNARFSSAEVERYVLRAMDSGKLWVLQVLPSRPGLRPVDVMFENSGTCGIPLP